MQKTSQEEFRIEKVIKKKGDKLYVKWKGQIIHLIIGFIKRCYKMSQYFPKPYESFGGDINGKMNLSNYVAKADLRNATGVDTSKFAKKVDLASLKSNVDILDSDKLKNIPTNSRYLKSKVEKLDIDKLAPAPVNLSELSNVVKNDVVKKDVYNAKVKNIEDKMPDITNLATKTTLNPKINDVKR